MTNATSEAFILRRAAQIVTRRAPRDSIITRYIAGFLRRLADKVEEKFGD